MPGTSVRRLVRPLAFVLALTLSLFAVSTVQTQTRSHAVVPVVAAVAGTAARTVIPKVARYAVPAARGTIKWLGIGKMLCSFFDSSACDLSWGQDDDEAPNDDQGDPVLREVQGHWEVAPAYAGSFQADELCLLGAGDFPRTLCVKRAPSQQGNSNGLGQLELTGYWDPATVPNAPFIHVAGYSYNNLFEPRWSTNPRTVIMDLGSTQFTRWPARLWSSSGALLAEFVLDEPLDMTKELPDPEREGQAWRECSDGAGGLIRVAGPAFTYRESETERTAPLPACPESHPQPAGGGIVVGSPWSPGQVIPLSAPLPAPLVPPQTLPGPSILPLAPATPTPVRIVAPTQANPTPGVPLPQIGLDGKPIIEADGTVRPQPRPLPLPDGNWCLWGGYVVDASDCIGAPPPAPPTAPPTDPPFDPCNPLPGSGFDRCDPEGPDEDDDGIPDDEDPDDDGDGIPDEQDPDHDDEEPDVPNDECRRPRTNPVGDVFEGVRCALVWAFVPRRSTLDRLDALRDDLGSKVPFGYVGAVRSMASDTAGAASGCWDGLDVQVWDYSSRVLDLCPGSQLREGLSPLRGVLTFGIWLGMLVPLGLWVFRQSVPVIGGGDH